MWLLKKLLKPIIYDMILKGELRFNIHKGESVTETPNKKYYKKYDTIALVIKDENDLTIALSETKLKDVVFEKHEIE